ncbi:hypothetical protein [Brevibacillus formosus]|uniref:hypothetical protein n=1 Tax=Brevibacillus formosus TaxID=54913 RepID=UPI003F1C721D
MAWLELLIVTKSESWAGAALTAGFIKKADVLNQMKWYWKQKKISKNMIACIYQNC